MDIKNRLTQEEKGELASLGLECQVLTRLLKERKDMLGNKANEILARLALSPQMYSLKFNPSQDLWEAELKEGALVVPNRQTRRATKGRQN